MPCTTGMDAHGPPHVVMAFKFGVSFLLISFIFWDQVCTYIHVRAYIHKHAKKFVTIKVQACKCMHMPGTASIIVVIAYIAKYTCIMQGSAVLYENFSQAII